MAETRNYSVKGTMALAFPFDSLSRKLALKKEVAGKNVPFVVGTSYWTSANKHVAYPKRQFFWMRKNYRSTAPSDDERLNRIRFAAVSKAVWLRMKNLSTISADQAAFLAQRDAADGIKSFKGYIWSLELEVYDQAHPQGWSNPHTSAGGSSGGDSDDQPTNLHEYGSDGPADHGGRP